MIDDIYDSAEGFANALDRLADQFEEESELAIRKTMIDLSTKIIKDTPVDTGRARAAWILTTDYASDAEPPEKEYPGYQTENPPAADDPGKSRSGKYFLVNNLEYISVLENGSSLQSPTGMVANSLNAFDRLLTSQLDGMETIK